MVTIVSSKRDSESVISNDIKNDVGVPQVQNCIVFSQNQKVIFAIGPNAFTKLSDISDWMSSKMLKPYLFKIELIIFA